MCRGRPVVKGYGFIEVPMGPDVFFLPSALPKDS